MAAALFAQNNTATVLIGVEPKHDGGQTQIIADDLRVREAGKDRQVTALAPLENAPTQIALLIDDSAGFSFGSQLNTLKQFVSSLPSQYQVAVGYMHNGMTQFTQQFTSDHAAAANSVRLSMGPGGADVSPYDSLSDAIKHWSPAPDVQRRVAIMITSGIEALGGGYAPENPYVNKSIRDAQRAGVVVYGIYNPSGGHLGHTLWRISEGQNLLSQTADETGGEAYISTLGEPPVDLSPYFKEILESLQHQYRLTFTLDRQHKAGFETLSVRAREKDLDIRAPSAIYVGR